MDNMYIYIYIYNEYLSPLLPCLRVVSTIKLCLEDGLQVHRVDAYAVLTSSLRRLVKEGSIQEPPMDYQWVLNGYE